MAHFVPPARLGLGFTYQQGLRVAIEAALDLIDFLEVSPDTLCVERVAAGARSLDYTRHGRF